jgi:hypothetical protein
MRTLETQSKDIIITWCTRYAGEFVLPIYEAAYPLDGRIRAALDAARKYSAGNIKQSAAKKIAYCNCRDAARESENHLAAQAAARACGQAALTVHTPLHSIGMVFYAMAAIAYSRAGIAESKEVYDRIAEEECAKAEASLYAVLVQNEPNPAKLNWWKNSIFGQRK